MTQEEGVSVIEGYISIDDPSFFQADNVTQGLARVEQALSYPATHEPSLTVNS